MVFPLGIYREQGFYARTDTLLQERGGTKDNQ